MPPSLQVGMVVKDAGKVARFYSSTFGIGPWEIRAGEGKTEVRDHVYTFKTKVALAQMGPVTLELFQVTEGRSPVHAVFLDQGREGVHHVGFYVSKEEKERIIADLDKANVKVFQEGETMRGTYTFLDTEKTGGLFFELIARRA